MVESFYDMMVLYTKSTELLELKNKNREGEEINMCQAIKEMLQDERREGRAEGREEGIEAFVLDNIEENIPEERICEKLQRRFHFSEEEAKRLYQKYAFAL